MSSLANGNAAQLQSNFCAELMEFLIISFHFKQSISLTLLYFLDVDHSSALPVYGWTGFSSKWSSLSRIATLILWSGSFLPVLMWLSGCLWSTFYLSAGLHTIIWLHLRQEWLNSTGAPNLFDSVCLCWHRPGVLKFGHRVSANLCSLCSTQPLSYLTSDLVGKSFLHPCSLWNLQLFHWSWKTHKENKILALSYQGSAARGCEVDWFLIYSEWQAPFFACRGVKGLRARIHSVFFCRRRQKTCLFASVQNCGKKPFSRSRFKKPLEWV